VSQVRKFPRAKPHRLGKFEVKALVRHRDGYRCQECGVTARQHVRKYKKTLDVHRLVPGSRYTIKGCITLCRKCHGPQPKSPNGKGPGLFAMLPEELKARLDRLAEHRSRKLTAEVVLALRRYLDEEERKEGLYGVPLDDQDDD
jgi:cytochrome c553